MNDFDLARAVEDYGARLFTYAYALLCNYHEAEDAVQDAFAAAWQGRDGFDGENLRAWLYRITGNRCLDMLRRRGLLTFDELREETAAGPEEGGDGFSDTTMRALGRLSAADRAVARARGTELRGDSGAARGERGRPAQAVRAGQEKAGKVSDGS